MKKVTTVLTTVCALAALAAAAAPRPAQAQAAALDPTLAAAASAAAPTSDEQALLAAINAQRTADGVGPLTWDPALAAAARYQQNDQIKVNFYGPFAYGADGKTQVTPATLAADFASPATGIGDSEFSNVFNPTDTGNWPALVRDWRPQDPGFAAMLGSSAVNACGLSIVSNTSRSGAVSYRWALVYGQDAKPGVPPAMVGKGYDLGLAFQATQGNPSPDEQALFAAINAQRAANGVGPLTWGAGLAAAACYQQNDQIKVNFYGPFAYLADGKTQIAPAQVAADFGATATISGDSEFSNVFNPTDTGNWPALVRDWRPQDPGFAAMLGSASVNVGGVSIVANTSRSGAVSYRWALVYGSKAGFTSGAPTPPPAPTLNLVGLDPALAAKAKAAQMTANEQALLAAINQFRTTNGACALTLDPALNAAAHYQALDQAKVGFLAPLAYGADGHTPVAPAALAADFASGAANVQDFAFTNNVLGGKYLVCTGNWLREAGMWRSLDMTCFGAMLGSGAVNACGVAVVQTGTATASNGTTYPVYAYSLIVGRK